MRDGMKQRLGKIEARKALETSFMPYEFVIVPEGSTLEAALEAAGLRDHPNVLVWGIVDAPHSAEPVAQGLLGSTAVTESRGLLQDLLE